MYNNEPIDDYIRSVLGYPNSNNMYADNFNTVSFSNMSDENLEDCYPEIYKVVYPMISKRCSQCGEVPSRDLVDRLTDEIYSAIEVNNEITLNINLQNEVSSNSSQVETVNNRNVIKEVTRESKSKKDVREDRIENRQVKNRGLNDLIRILIIRELLGRPGHRPSRPPFLGGPGGGRPPMRPRGYFDYEFYEQ